MTEDELLYFERMPQMLPVYTVFRDELKKKYPDISIKVSKTQISFRNRHIFAMASLPWRKVKGWPAQYLLISFGLPCRKESSRIAQAVEAYPNRWTHHVAIETEKEIDNELMQWVDEAFQFSMFK